MTRPLTRLLRSAVAMPLRWWARQSLRARLTLLATALFSIAVITGAILLLQLQRVSLVRVLDQSAQKTGRDIARLVAEHKTPRTVVPTSGGIAAVQVIAGDSTVVAASQGTDHTTPLLTPQQLHEVRAGARIEIASTNSEARLRVLGRPVGSQTVIVLTDVTRVDDSVRILGRAALIGGPLAVLLMAGASYSVVALTLRPVAALRQSAAAITAAGLAQQRLPVPGAQDEIHRLAVTLNAMLDRIDSATSRQRTFVGDAAHELRSPIASLRVQLEVAQRLGPAAEWPELIDDVLVDVDRIDRLVADLLALARLDESGGLAQRHEVHLDELARTVVDGYAQARVEVAITTEPASTMGDPDGLRRVIINLVDNAVRHAGSHVQVEVTNPGGGMCVLTVVDDGAGIPEAERERVFDRFYRVQQSRSRETGGTGLGLAIVRDLVRRHGGRIALHERTDGASGLCAVVELPAA